MTQIHVVFNAFRKFACRLPHSTGMEVVCIFAACTRCWDASNTRIVTGALPPGGWLLDGFLLVVQNQRLPFDEARRLKGVQSNCSQVDVAEVIL